MMADKVRFEIVDERNGFLIHIPASAALIRS
jgi:hypothetical protein